MAAEFFASVKTVFRLWGIYAKLDLLWFVRDTRYCLLQIAADTIASVAAVSAVLLIAARFGGIAGMSSREALFLCGYAVLTDGLFVFFCGGGNVGYISRVIGRGQLDHKLIQPVPIWAQLLTEGFMPFSGCIRLLFGIGLTVYAASRLHVHLTCAWAALFGLSLVCSMAVILSVIYIVSCCAFYAPAAAEEISGSVVDLFAAVKFYPLGGLSAKGALAFCSLLPVGMAAWFPSNVLLGKSPAGLPAFLLFLVAALITALAILLFRKGLFHYEKYGSNRYTGFGHR